MILRKFISIKTITIILLLSVVAFANYLPTDQIKNFTLPDYNGKEHSLSDYKNSKAIVIMFVATECPVSNAYNSRMEDLFKEYNPKRYFISWNKFKQSRIS